MKWRVVWAVEAGTEVQRILSGSRFAQQFANEITAFDARLRRAPESVGESREGIRRIAIEWPFVFIFDVYAEQHTILVTDFRLLG